MAGITHDLKRVLFLDRRSCRSRVARREHGGCFFSAAKSLQQKCDPPYHLLADEKWHG